MRSVVCLKPWFTRRQRGAKYLEILCKGHQGIGSILAFQSHLHKAQVNLKKGRGEDSLGTIWGTYPPCLLIFSSMFLREGKMVHSE